MEFFLAVVGIIVGIIGGILLLNGWNADPQQWGLIIGGGVMVVIGFGLSGWIILID